MMHFRLFSSCMMSCNVISCSDPESHNGSAMPCAMVVARLLATMLESVCGSTFSVRYGLVSSSTVFTVVGFIISVVFSVFVAMGAGSQEKKDNRGERGWYCGKECYADGCMDSYTD